VAFVSLLQQARVELLVDVRAYPASRRHPHFARQPLARSLASAGIAYDWRGSPLGGMRPDGYLAHMQTPEFEQAARGLMAIGAAHRVCIMCAESDPSDCHRWHISDWLVAHGERVVHLIAEGESREHAARLC
jgi:uncharacterized protein (DUF488 family)